MKTGTSGPSFMGESAAVSAFSGASTPASACTRSLFRLFVFLIVRTVLPLWGKPDRQSQEISVPQAGQRAPVFQPSHLPHRGQRTHAASRANPPNSSVIPGTVSQIQPVSVPRRASTTPASRTIMAVRRRFRRVIYRTPLYSIFSSFAISLRLMVRILLTPCSCMVTP